MNKELAIECIKTQRQFVDNLTREAFDVAISLLDSKPGYWTAKEGETAFWDVCSECGEKVLHQMPHYKYCPHCGKQMKIY